MSRDLPPVLLRRLNAERSGGPAVSTDVAQLRTSLHRLVDGLPLADLEWVGQGAFAGALRQGSEAAVAAHFDDVVRTGVYGDLLEELRRAGSRRVLYVSRRPYFTLLREARHLRDLGWKCFLVHLEPIERSIELAYDAHIDRRVRMRNNTLLLEAFLRAAEVEIIHVECWMMKYGLGAAVVRSRPRAKVVCEFYDVTSLYAPRDVLAERYPAEEVDYELAMEGVIFREADAVVTRFHPAAYPTLAERHGPLTRLLHLLPYPSRYFGRRAPAPPTPQEGQRRVVFAGGAPHMDASVRPGAFPIHGLPAALTALAAQDVAVDVLHDPQRPVSPTTPGFECYHELAARHPHFRIMNGVSPDRVADVLAAYDYGLLLFEMHPSRLRTCIELTRDGYGTKLFTYFEAGLPVIVNREYTAMARLVEEHGLGLVVATDEIPTLGARLRAADVNAHRRNVERFAVEHSMDREIAKLVSLYDDLLSGPHPPARGAPP